jgi:hypothetical protein
MPRALRIEREGAIYQVMNRGDGRDVHRSRCPRPAPLSGDFGGGRHQDRLAGSRAVPDGGRRDRIVGQVIYPTTTPSFSSAINDQRRSPERRYAKGVGGLEAGLTGQR